MSSKRIGLADRDNNVRKNRLNVLFTPSAQAENYEDADRHETATAEVAETAAKTEPKAEVERKKDKRPAKEAKPFRQTYYMLPEIVEAVRIMDFETREGISTIINRILKENISEDVLQQARKNLKKRSGGKEKQHDKV